jgi:endonuclease YncB( thermonuclease family)
LFALAALRLADAQAEPVTRVMLNGVPTPVFFNDGDSFRILAGPLKGTTARLAGFNTLESYGATQQWGDWHPKELYFLAKMGTYNARRGQWHCTSDLKRDGYGRMLWHCHDLAIDQIRQGFAHAMTVTDAPSPPDFLEAQREAIAARRGIWAHGVPDYIVTSVHSAAEAWSGKTHYNRLISTKDGHSLRWEHGDVYKECQDVCYSEFQIDPEHLKSACQALRAEADLADALKGVSEEQLSSYVNAFVRTGKIAELGDDPRRAALETHLKAYRDEQRLGNLQTSPPSCMTYTDFTRRFGAAKAPCLK